MSVSRQSSAVGVVRRPLELLLHVLDLCAQARDLPIEVLADLGYVLLEFATDFVGEAGDLPAQVLK